MTQARSQRFISWQSAAAGDSPAFTCPAGYTMLVKSVLAYTATATPGHYAVLASSNSPSSTIVIANEVLTQSKVSYVATWTVMHPGDAMYVNTDTVGVAVWVAGALLVGAPQFPPAELAVPEVFPPIAGHSGVVL